MKESNYSLSKVKTNQNTPIELQLELIGCMDINFLISFESFVPSVDQQQQQQK